MAGAECSLFPPPPPLLLNEYRELVLGTLFIGTTNTASGRLEGSAGSVRKGSADSVLQKARRSALPMSMEARPAPRGLC
eukprot:1153571-Pelagomonas_calceolata.AAC.3